jgi:hypothetical protein
MNLVNVFSFVSELSMEQARKSLRDNLESRDVILLNRSLVAIPINHLDQESSYNVTDAQWVWKNGKEVICQTFVPRSSFLSGIEVVVGHKGDAGLLAVELRGTNDEGVPDNRILDEVILSNDSVASNERLLIPLHQNLTSGREYSVVFRQVNGSNDSYWYVGRSPFKDTYPNGSMLYSSNGGHSWNFTIADIAFKTYYPEARNTSNLEDSIRSDVSLYLLDVTNYSRKEIDELPLNQAKATIVNWRMPHPGEYSITLDCGGKFNLIIAESFDSHWQVSGISDSVHFPAFSFLNGYTMNASGTINLTIEYSLNGLTDLGSLVSIVSIGCVVVLLTNPTVYRFFSKRRNGNG